MPSHADVTTDTLSTAHVRTAVKTILREFGLTNQFQVRTISFEGFGYGRKRFVTICGWSPNPVAEQLKQRIHDRTQAIAEFRTAQA